MKTPMKTFVLVLLVLVMVSGSVAAQSYHDPVYVWGAWPWPTTTTPNDYLKGIMMMDNSGPSPLLSTLTIPGYQPGSVNMDVDNRSIVFGVRGSASVTTLMNSMRSGLFRYDPVTTRLTTIYRHVVGTTAYHAFYHAVVDYNGDYVTAVYNFDSTKSIGQYEIWKVDQSGKCTTLLTSTKAGLSHPWGLYGRVRINIDNGKLLVNDLYRVWTPSYITYFKIFEVDMDHGLLNTWHAPPPDAGWAGWNCMPQNHRTGDIEGPYNTTIFRVRRGTASRTTLATLTMPGSLGAYTQGDYDLQTAAMPRQVHAGYNYSNPQLTYLYHVDAKNWTVTSFSSVPFRNYNYAGFEFFRGRHTQTVRTKHLRWDIRFSAPKYPGRGYVAAAGLSGVRPGVTLKDGRNLNLNVDAVTVLTLSNLIPAIWNGGPGKLDSNGEAKGFLDLSMTTGLGVPIWIVWVVLDPAAPLGIAYIPDTYVVRV